MTQNSERSQIVITDNDAYTLFIPVTSCLLFVISPVDTMIHNESLFQPDRWHKTMSIPAASLSTDQALPSFYYGRQTKPLFAVESLVSAFRPASSPFALPRSTYYRFPPTQAESGLILLEEGIASLCHAENNMVISTIFSPSLLGLIDGYGVFNGIPEKHHCSLFAETDLRGHWIGHQAAVEILNEKNLWQDMAHVLAQRLMVLLSLIHISEPTRRS